MLLMSLAKLNLSGLVEAMALLSALLHMSEKIPDFVPSALGFPIPSDSVRSRPSATAIRPRPANVPFPPRGVQDEPAARAAGFLGPPWAPALHLPLCLPPGGPARCRVPAPAPPPSWPGAGLGSWLADGPARPASLRHEPATSPAAARCALPTECLRWSALRSSSPLYSRRSPSGRDCNRRGFSPSRCWFWWPPKKTTCWLRTPWAQVCPPGRWAAYTGRSWGR